METRNPKFNNKDGSLTWYAFCCGYIMEAEPRPDVSIQLWMEHSHFSVRAHDRKSGRLKAKRFFAAKKREITNQRLEPALSKKNVTDLEPVLGGIK
jgi:hypothetical protein